MSGFKRDLRDSLDQSDHFTTEEMETQKGRGEHC